MIYNNILETIGNTPIVKVNRSGVAGRSIYAKVESFNPMHSVKDRLAFAIINDAKQRGELAEGQTVVEATSGNTGIALAMVCAALEMCIRDRYIICGDWNIAHENIDIKNWRSNQKNSGFLPEERAWIGNLFTEHGWIDTHRVLKPGVAEYTWWSNRGQAYANDVGWRIDYQIVSPNLKDCAKSVTVHRTPRFSDHAPLCVEYQL